MMTDHELLQRAATAAGKHFDPTRHDKRGLWVVKQGASCQSDPELWNPLVYAFQADELFGTIGMEVLPTYAGAICTHPSGAQSRWANPLNPLAAMRRAIVLCAAGVSC